MGHGLRVKARETAIPKKMYGGTRMMIIFSQTTAVMAHVFAKPEGVSVVINDMVESTTAIANAPLIQAKFPDRQFSGNRSGLKYTINDPVVMPNIAILMAKKAM